MAENTGIQWCTHTFNPWWGCQVVSPGCDHCYARDLAVKRRKLPVWGDPAKSDRKEMSESYWKHPAKWERKAIETGERPRVFPSMCDPFERHPKLDPIRARFFETIEATPHVDWLLLTKRPENALDLVPESWKTRFPDNAWFGFSAETQETYEARLGHAARVRAPVRFVSAEPLLEEIDFAFFGTCPADWGVGYTPVGWIIDWVIFGGESGPHARPCALEWIRSGVEQCRAHDVVPFVKQVGARPYYAPEPVSAEAADRFIYEQGHEYDPDPTWLKLADRKGGRIDEWPEDLRVREFPEPRR